MWYTVSMIRPITQQTVNTQNRLKKFSAMNPRPSLARPSVPAAASRSSSLLRRCLASSRSRRSEGSTVEAMTSRMAMRISGSATCPLKPNSMMVMMPITMFSSTSR